MNTKKEKQLSQLARRIREARQHSRLSQSSLARGIGVSDKAISSYEQGRSNPPFEKLQKIAQQTNYPVSFFIGETETEGVIAQKLSTIERELAEVKRLLKQTKK